MIAAGETNILWPFRARTGGRLDRLCGTVMAPDGMIDLRPCRAGDALDVVRMVGLLSAHENKAPPYFTVETYRRDVLARDSYVRGVIARRRADGAPAGYTLFHPAYDSESGERGAYMVDLFVAAEVRRCGLGRALVAAVARGAQDWGGSFIWWSAKTYNAEAMRFYAGIAEQELQVASWACFGAKFRALLEAQP